MEIINRRKLYKLDAKRAKLEEERLASQLGDNGNVSSSFTISEEKLKETEAHQRLSRKDIHNPEDGNVQSETKRRIDSNENNPEDPDCKVTKLKSKTDKEENKNRSDYSGLFKVFGLLLTFSSLGFFMIFK